MATITIGVDLAKRVFATCEVDDSGRVLRRQELSRDGFTAWLAQQLPGTVIAMEACTGAHHWGRRCQEFGLAPKMMAAQFVAPFRKRQSIKNDRNDAEAIATAARQGNMRFVPVKSAEQQAQLSLHRLREASKQDCLAIANRARGLLAEFGVVMPQGDAALRRVLGGLGEHPELPVLVVELLDDLAGQWVLSRARLDALSARIQEHGRHDERCRRAQAIIGVGPVTAHALVSTVGNAADFGNGRQLAAWLGLTPAQHSSGGRSRLGSITCRGDAYLRTLLIQGARSSLQRAKAVTAEKATPEQIWIRSLSARLSFGKVLVAIANKHARQLWAMLARGEDYDPEAWLKHPMVQRPASQH